jgi:hypothetical protein
MAKNILGNINGFNPNKFIDNIRLETSDDSLAFKRVYNDEYKPEYSYGKQETITHPAWSDGKFELKSIYTSSNQTFNTKIYYRNVYDSLSLDNGVQFSIAYGDINNFGSTTGSNEYISENVYESKAIYSQYKNILSTIHTSSDAFSFKNFYVISINSENMHDSITQGGWQLSLSEIDSNDNVVVLTNPVTLVDESIGINNKVILDEYVYNIKEGTLSGGLSTTASFDSWGYFYPKNGIILLDASILSSSGYLITDRAEPTGSGAVFMSSNADRLFTSISGAMAINSDAYSFRSTVTERLESIVVFIKIINNEFNYTNNTTTVYDRTNYKIKEELLDNGYNFSYITQIGLYNDYNELIAVAKLSKPIRKNKETELVIRVRIRN